MEAMILHVGGVVAPVLLCALAGYGIAVLKLPFDKDTIGTLTIMVGTPALILSNLAQQHVQLSGFLSMMLAAAAVYACFGVIGVALLKSLKLPLRGFLGPTMFTNMGNIGLPVCALAFGSQGLSYAMAFVVVGLVGIYTIGMWLPKGEVSLRWLLTKPTIYAVVLALVLMATETRLPAPVASALNILGGLTIPLMLLLLGHSIATMNVNSVARGWVLALLHLFMAVGVAFILNGIFGFEGVARGVFILQCVMPASVATYLMVQLYDPEDAPNVSGFVLISTLLTIVVLPIVLTFWVST